jgi:hypothetical protein
MCVTFQKNSYILYFLLQYINTKYKASVYPMKVFVYIFEKKKFCMFVETFLFILEKYFCVLYVCSMFRNLIRYVIFLKRPTRSNVHPLKCVRIFFEKSL